MDEFQRYHRHRAGPRLFVASQTMESGVESMKWGKEYEERVDNHLGSGKNQAADHEHRFRKVIDVEAIFGDFERFKIGRYPKVSHPYRISGAEPFASIVQSGQRGCRISQNSRKKRRI